MQENPPGGGLHFPDLRIQGFRGIRDLSISPLGRVTLITGKNNTGKSSILEALRLHTQNAVPRTVYDILEFREEYVGRADDEDRLHDPESFFHVSALFHGFPRLSDKFGSIVISTKGNTHPMDLKMFIDWFREERDPDGRRRLVAEHQSSFEEPERLAVLVIKTEEGKRFYRLDHLLRHVRRSALRPPDGVRMSCVLVSPYGGEETGTLGHLWDEIALTDSEQDMVEALCIIDPQISAVSMVGGETRFGGRTAIVRADNIPRPVPLRSFGDGMNRLFAIVLSLVNARDGILLVDEFENGLHHSVQLDVWRIIFRLAQRLNVQVFATTHSADAVKAFQKASADEPEEGALVRLARRGGDIISTVFEKNEVAITVRHRIEVR